MSSAAARRLGVRALAPIALMVAIFYFSGRESVGPDLPGWTRVVVHFGEYAVLAGLWAWALAPALGRRALLAAGVITFAYAISDEYHQSFVEGRDSDPFDVLIDTLGIVTALLVIGSGSLRGPER